MLRFSVFPGGAVADKVDLSGAYLFGSDGVPLRADIELRKGQVMCRKRAPEPAALAILWSVGKSGKVLLQTTRLQERDKPYVLEVELLRGRLMHLLQKREEWGLADWEFTAEQDRRLAQCRDALIESFKADEPIKAAAIAQAGLECSVELGEHVALDNAAVLLDRRRHVGGFTRRVFGCAVNPRNPNEAVFKRLASAFDFAVLPLPWKLIEPNEQEFNWKPLDKCVEWLAKHRIPIKGSGLVCFRDENCIPDWLYIWEHDFETIRNLIYDHIRRVVNRYGNFIQVWDVISGIHATRCFAFSYEQLMELTRMSAAITRQLAPQATVIVDLVSPWGEYYARDQQTIPPLLYADVVVQSGISFDAFGLHLYFGMGQDGMYVRDLFQISAMLDRFALLGKPLHITATQVPSTSTGKPDDAWKGQMSPTAGGVWRSPWDESVQADWLKGFCEIALSKPFVETVTWRDLSDQGLHYLPGGGLLRADLSAKPAFERMVELRNNITRGANASSKLAR
ncbi:MAG: endo-1,4-beta-xylanase [Phycisphaerae bacterium]|nr:endo-1,4-beta-xylanase [Phycisphaerae bacterium]